jgi:hypothetical protein
MAGTTGRSFGARALRIDRAVYLLDEETKTYRYLRRNPDWESLDPRENERNKRHLNGSTRIFSDGRRKVFRYRPATSIGGYDDLIEPFPPDERVDLATAVAAFTMGSAYVNHLDDVTGSIEVGKQADVILLDRDTFAQPVDEISQASVELTFVGGRCLHDASVTAGPLDHRSNAVLRRPREGRASREGRDAPPTHKIGRRAVAQPARAAASRFVGRAEGPAGMGTSALLGPCP